MPIEHLESDCAVDDSLHPSEMITVSQWQLRYETRSWFSLRLLLKDKYTKYKGIVWPRFFQAMVKGSIVVLKLLE